MASNDNLVAQILESSAVGYAGLTVSLLLERHPDLARRYEPDGFTAWQTQLQQWIVDLSAAVHAGEPGLFEQRMRWARHAFRTRQAPLADLLAALGALRETLRERLPADSADAALAPLDRARGVLEREDDDRSDDASAAAPPRPALAYLEKILEGYPRAAIELLLQEVDGGRSARAVYSDVLLPALREAGRMWHSGELGIAEEHAVTTTSQRAMALLCERARPATYLDRTVVLACVAGNVHELGLRAVSDFFEMAGWRTIHLGADVPAQEIARSVEIFGADLVVLAAALDPHLKETQRAIEQVRSVEDRSVRVLVGGTAFGGFPELWRNLGADGYASDVEDAEPLGSQLVS